MSLVTITIALASGAPITILDEPVSGLDVYMRDRFYALLLEEYARSNRTFILSTHIIEEAANVLEDVVSEEAEEEKAFAVASKYAASKRITERKDLAKVGAYLWQRGFGRDTIDRALDRIASSLREPEE